MPGASMPPWPPRVTVTPSARSISPHHDRQARSGTEEAEESFRMLTRRTSGSRRGRRAFPIGNGSVVLVIMAVASPVSPRG